MDKKDYFWKMKEYYPEGYGYGQFSFSHIVMIGIAFVFSFGMSYFYRTGDPETDQIMRMTVALSLMLLDAWKFGLILMGNGEVRRYLPLELCSIGGLFIVHNYIPGLSMGAQELFKMTPYVVTILVLVIVSTRKKRENLPPASLGLSYFREDR